MNSSHPKDPVSKRCSKCQETKGAHEFYASYRNRECLEAWCKKCKSSTRNKKVTWGLYWPELTTEEGDAEYNKLFFDQSGRCAICDKHQSELLKALAVDHSHESGEVRGLLCQECNLALGKFHDCVERINRALTYLKKPKIKILKEGAQC